VRFAQAVRTLETQGTTTLVEIGPDAVLSALATELMDLDGSEHLVLPLLRRDRSEPGTLLHGVSLLHTRGIPVDWRAFYAGTGANRVDLPTYAFRRDSYWLRPTPDVNTGPGLSPTGHPLLGTAIALAGSDDLVFTGRVSARTHPWLEQHTVLGNVVLSAASLVETAVRAGDEAGATVLEELSLTAPLVLPPRGAVQLQVRVGAPDADGRRLLAIHARPDAEHGERPWTEHAQGCLGTRATPIRGGGAGDAVTEVRLPAELAEDTARFGLHPALLDAVLLDHPFGESAGTVTVPAEWRGVRLHVSGATAVRAVMTEISDHTVALELVDEQGRLVATVDSLTYREIPEELFASATSGAADALLRVEWVAAVTDELARPVSWAVLGDDGFEDLATIGKAAESGLPVDAVLVPWAFPDGGGSSGALHDGTRRAVTLVREWLADERLADTRLVVVTRGAVAAGVDRGNDPAEPIDLAAAAVRGLLRSARSEAADRIVLVDADPYGDPPRSSQDDGRDPADDAVLGVPSALLTSLLASEELDAAVRRGQLLVPRLARVAPAAVPTAAALDPVGTVLVTGGGGLGGLFARHLVDRYGVRRLLLVGREGEREPGAADLAAELTALGADVIFEACDLSDRDALAAVLGRVPGGHPLTAVVHAAGLADGGTLQGLDLDCLDEALRTAADGARHLHELTKDAPPAAFVLFSSTAGTVSGPGRAYRAAADAYVDALALHRAAQGLPSLSIAWGPWEWPTPESDAGRPRQAHRGFRPLTTDLLTAAFDAALGLTRRSSRAPGTADMRSVQDAVARHPVLVAALVDPSALRAQEGAVPPQFRGLLRGPARPALGATGRDTGDGGEALARQLAGLDDDERHRVVRELVRREVAAVLGHTTSGAVSLERSFQDSGFDSMTGVDLRNRLGAATGLRLPATVVFDHPTPAALIRFVLGEVASGESPAGPTSRPPLPAQLDRLEATVAELRPDTPDQDRTEISARLQMILNRLAPSGADESPQRGSEEAASRIAAASADEIFDFIDTELGRGSGQ
ncbi:type I polyketide synthase, partial [Streptomyces mirabilis]|uniref:type I polyketide synthase n=1 Tax=Streptomyces mirabilis TaxID=68239 RepID=UPI0036D19F0D